MSGTTIEGPVATHWFSLKALRLALRAEIEMPGLRLSRRQSAKQATREVLGLSPHSRIPATVLLTRLEKHIEEYEAANKPAIAAGITQF